MSGSVSHPARSRAYAAVAAAGLVLALVGCSDDDPKAGAEETPSATASPTADSSEPSPTEEASASVTPATGVLLDMPHATINAPKGWKQLEDFLDFGTEANPPTGTGAVRLTQLEFPGPEISVDLQAKAALQGRLGDMKREPDVEIAGLTFYHLSGTPNKDSHLDTFGVLNDGFQTGIDFEFENKVPEAERQKIIDESLATFTWR
ncbi:hypothetical protein GCM10023350_12680 [Nocardioides endophyticus]|uniref:Lipoprotein n=1 Tax=Nocardioides endophyticus TaxID=1353775 RepID=A0ABP8YL46_9ACTN